MAAVFLLAALVCGPLLAQTSGTTGSPFYTADSIANSAANTAGPYAPNTFLTIYGENLAFVTRALNADDVKSGTLPTALTGAGVRVLVNLIPANLYLVSPRQVNVLIPPNLTAGPMKLQLVRDGVDGPAIQLTLSSSATGLFEATPGTVVATHLDGSLISTASPAEPGEVVVLYASGLGATSPAAIANRLAQQAAQVASINEFRVLLNGASVEATRILYAGLTPGFAGLFQINLRLPDNAPVDPEVQAGYVGQMSPPGHRLIVRPHN